MSDSFMDRMRGAFGLQTAHPAPQTRPLPFGVERRTSLYPGEDTYFQGAPHVAGMAADDGRVILNPYSKNDLDAQEAVAKNEAARLHMRNKGVTPVFSLSDEQRRQFDGTPYARDEAAMRQTIAARMFSGDPSAKSSTPEQLSFVRWLAGGLPSPGEKKRPR